MKMVLKSSRIEISVLCLMLFLFCYYGLSNGDGGVNFRQRRQALQNAGSLDIYFSDSCLYRTPPPKRRTLCPGRGIYWREPLNESRVVFQAMAIKNNMTISSCREFCYLTEGCRGANLRINGQCELVNTDKKPENLIGGTVLLYDCCDQRNATCEFPTIEESKVVCENGYIQWLPKMDGLFMEGSFLGVKRNQTITACQEFCYETPGCVAINYRQTGDCTIMPTLGAIREVSVMSLLTYRCCKSVDGGWSEWSNASECDKTTNIMTRTRQCNNPIPFGGGSDCQGNSYENTVCKVNGNWSEWSEFSACHEETNIKTRTRKCNKPKPLGGGSDCEGSAVENKDCDEWSGSSNYSYTPDMQTQAENVTLWWNLKAILCSADGEFVVNWNEIRGSTNWTQMWYKMVKDGDYDGLHAFIMMPEQGKGRFVEIRLVRSGTNAIIKAIYSHKTAIFASPTVVSLNVNATFHKENGTSEVFTQFVRHREIFGLVANDFVKIPLPWDSLDVTKLPVVTMKFRKIQTR
jgi:Cu/Ag efflux protein CusF